MFPIVGVRYKCSVRPNFDYCAKCEETKNHEYAFIKIKRASQAPQMIVTAVNDDNTGNTQSNNQPSQDPGAFLRGIMGAMGGQRGQNRCGPNRSGPGQAPQMPTQDFNNQEAWKAWGDQMKQWGEGMAQQFGGPGHRGRGGSRGRGGHGGCGMGGWRRWANQGFGCGDGQNQGAWEGPGGHKVNRAKIVKAP